MSVVITAVAMRSPVGANAVQSCAALRAGITRLTAHPFYTPEAPSPMIEPPALATAAVVPDPGVGRPRADRIQTLGLSSAPELIDAGRLARTDFAGLVVLPSLPPKMPDGLVDRMFDQLGVTPQHIERPRTEGSTGMLAALLDAKARLEARAAKAVVIVGLESMLDEETMLALDRSRRLKSERNPDGFVPAEAAVWLLVETAEGAAKRGVKPRARLIGTGEGREANAFTSGRNPGGGALCTAIKTALGGYAGPTWPLADLNGESYRSFEWGVVLSRLGDQLAGLTEITHPADAIGDTGAAAGGVLAALACHAFERNNAKAPRALIWCGADGGERVACLLAPP